LDISYLGALGAGALSFLSPCVLPLVPAYIGYIAGATFEELAEPEKTKEYKHKQGRVAFAALAFVLGFTTVFVSLGASASAISALLITHLDILGKIAGVAIILFGIHFMGLLRIPGMNSELRFHPALRPSGLLGAYLIGAAFAFGWTPCIGPILATVLTVAASEDQIGYGVSLLAVYSAGLGVPFLLAALGLQPFMRFFVRFRRHIHKVEIATGAAMAITGIAIFTGSLSNFSFFLLETFPFLAKIG
jgi:cytochrome c-type biogenesis protein